MFERERNLLMSKPIVFSLGGQTDQTCNLAADAEFKKRLEKDKKWDNFEEWYEEKQREVQAMFKDFDIKDKDHEEEKLP